MSERLERITPEMDEEKALGLILDELMDRAEPDVAEAIRFCTIPHWFNDEILAWLRGEGREPSQRTREILAALTGLTFVGPYHDRGYAYHENVRNLLLRRWRQEAAERFQELSGVAAAYYADKLGVRKSWLGRMADKIRWALGREKAPTEEQRTEWQREEMYHLLVADEEQGLGQFHRLFTRARDFYQLSTCTLLLQLVAEQSDHLSRDSQLWAKHYGGQLAYYSAQWAEAQGVFEELMGQELPPRLEPSVTHLLGMVYHDKGEWDKAIECYQRSLAIREKVGDEHEIATTFNGLGEVYRVKREWDKAIEYQQRSLAIWEKMGDEHGMAYNFNNLGAVYHDKGEWDKAIEYFQHSLAIFEKVGDEHSMATTFSNLGEVYRVKREWDKAIECHQRSLVVKEKMGDEYGMAFSYNNIAGLYQDQGKLKEAIPLFQTSIEILERIGDEYHAKIGRKNLEKARRELEAKKGQG